MPIVLASQPSRRTSGRPRGADSVLRREEILGVAAQVFSEEGFRSVSMSALARACDMSLTGLAHYFPTKDLLLKAVMDRRDELDDARIAVPGQTRARGWAYLVSLVELVRNNQSQPGIVRLFTTVAAEAVDPGHPANAWLRGHHRRAIGQIRLALSEAVEDGVLAQDTPVDSIARNLVATMDGLQLQWLSDPHYPDMASDFELLLDSLQHRWAAP